MSAAAWSDPPAQQHPFGLLGREDPWTEDAYRSLPTTMWPRIELLDGGLLVTPAPTGNHQFCARRLANLLESATREGWVLEGVNVRLSSDEILIPDVVITLEHPDRTYFGASKVVLVAEIVSPSTVSIDRRLKPPAYAEAGIPWYLRVELTGPMAPEVIVHRLEGDAYVEHARAHAGQTLRLEEPVAVAFDPAALKP